MFTILKPYICLLNARNSPQPAQAGKCRLFFYLRFRVFQLDVQNSRNKRITKAQ